MRSSRSSAYDGQVALVVNTASQCGFTPSSRASSSSTSEYGDQGLAVLGFPCNQFGNQDPGSNEEIGAFCQKNYGVSFPMFEKVDVNGDERAPAVPVADARRRPGLLGSAIKWNFTKFLVGRDGKVIKRYGSTTAPEKIADDIERALAA